MTGQHAKVLAAMGFTRISFGVQDFATPVQMKINRLQTFGLVRAANDVLREAGFTSVNVDLMYGLPAQTVASSRQQRTAAACARR
jgi:oxygen-independent coproporphyrinogen-3 oxidase